VIGEALADLATKGDSKLDLSLFNLHRLENAPAFSDAPETA
jgi:hypothetical protein